MELGSRGGFHRFAEPDPRGHTPCAPLPRPSTVYKHRCLRQSLGCSSDPLRPCGVRKAAPPASPLTNRLTKWNFLQEHWSTYEHEDFAIVQAFHILDYLPSCDWTTRVFTVHGNLLFAFNPVSMEPSLGFHKVLKVARCALFLNAFTFASNMSMEMLAYCQTSLPAACAVTARPPLSAESHPLYRSAEYLSRHTQLRSSVQHSPRSTRRKKSICALCRSPPFPMMVEFCAPRGQPGSQTTVYISSFASSPLLMLGMLVAAVLTQPGTASASTSSGPINSTRPGFGLFVPTLRIRQEWQEGTASTLHDTPCYEAE